MPAIAAESGVKQPVEAEPLAEDRRPLLIPAFELGIAKPIRTAATTFSAAPEYGVSMALTRRGSRWRLPVSVWLRPAIDPAPAESMWFLGAWLHPEVAIMSRVIASVGAGWCWRHLEIDGVSSTHGSLSIVSSIGVRLRLSPRIEGTLLARYDFAQPVSNEPFILEHVSVALSIAFVRS